MACQCASLTTRDTLGPTKPLWLIGVLVLFSTIEAGAQGSVYARRVLYG